MKVALSILACMLVANAAVLPQKGLEDEKNTLIKDSHEIVQKGAKAGFHVTGTSQEVERTGQIEYLLPRVYSNDWDVLIFTQNWPVSVCLAWEYKGKCNTCVSMQNTDSWTIHGIWPTKFGTIGPSFCNISRPFNPAGIYGIEDELEKRWSPIEKHKKKYMFWRHEWEKHGTCASAVEPLNSEFLYFQQGINWNKEYNMSTILNNAGVTPGKSYNITAVYSNVRQVLGKNPHITCFPNPATKASYLLEMRICFDKNLTLVDCDGIMIKYSGMLYGDTPGYTDCNIHQLIEYPLSSPYPPPIKIEEKHFIFDILKILQFISWSTW